MSIILYVASYVICCHSIVFMPSLKLYYMSYVFIVLCVYYNSYWLGMKSALCYVSHVNIVMSVYHSDDWRCMMRVLSCESYVDIVLFVCCICKNTCKEATQYFETTFTILQCCVILINKCIYVFIPKLVSARSVK